MAVEACQDVTHVPCRVEGHIRTAIHELQAAHVLLMEMRDKGAERLEDGGPSLNPRNRRDAVDDTYIGASYAGVCEAALAVLRIFEDEMGLEE